MRRLSQFRAREVTQFQNLFHICAQFPANDNASENCADVGRAIAIDVIHDKFLPAVNTEDAGQFDDQARFFPGLADGAVAGGFSRFDQASGKHPDLAVGMKP